MADLPRWADRAPGAPLVEIFSGSDAVAKSTGAAEPPVVVRVRPGAGSVPVDYYRITLTPAGGAPIVQDVPAATARASFEGLPIGAGIEVQAVALSIFGMASPSSGAASHTVGQRRDLPPDPATLVYAAMADGSRRYSWTIDPTAPDVQRRKIAGFVVRAAPGADLAWDDLVPFSGPIVGGSPLTTSEPVANGVHTIGLAAVDAYGRLCLNPLLATVTLGISAPARLGRLDFSLAAQSGQELDGWI